MNKNNTKTANYFELFGLEPNFLINEQELLKKLKASLLVTHPDKFANGSSQEQRVAMQKTTQLNDAFATLKSPVRRAQYLVHLFKGVDVTKEVTVKDPMFLMQQLELREELDHLAQQNDLSGLVVFSDNIEQMALKQESAIAEIFLADFNQKNFELEFLLNSIYKLQFLHKTLSDVEVAEDKILNS